MNRRSTSKAIEHIDLGEGDWVDLRVLNFGDRQAIMAAMIDPDTDAYSRERVEEANILELMRGIAAWGGPGFDCTCEGGHRCGKAPQHATDCHVMPIGHDEIANLNTTGDIILRLIDAKQDRARQGLDPFILSRPTSPSSEGGAGGTDSLPTSTSGTSSASGTSTSEPQ